MRRAALVVVAALAGTAHAQPRHLGDASLPTAGETAPRVSLVTFGVGERIFEKFGHAALCLDYEQEPLAHPPVCFNYGVTDFAGGAGMVWRFLRTEQRFWVEPVSRPDLFEFYEWEDRDIWVQELPLTDAQARQIEAKLLFDIQEAHRYYYYDHFRDNCTTRLRDMIDQATGGALKRATQAPFPVSFRELGVRGLADLPPLVALTDFTVGREVDGTETVWAAMFHPDVLRQEVEAVYAVHPEHRFARTGPPFPTSGSTDRAWALAIAVVFALPLALATWRRRGERLAAAWAALYLALWGVAIWGVAILSSIPTVRWNEAVLVLVPFDAVLPFLGAQRRRAYARVRVALLALASLLCAIGVLRQPLWVPILTAFLPLAIIAFGAFGQGPAASRAEP